MCYVAPGPVGELGMNVKLNLSLCCEGLHRRCDLQCGELGVVRVRTGCALRQPLQKDVVLRSSMLYSLASHVGQLHGGLAKEQALFRIYQIYASPAQLTCQGDVVQFRRVAAQ